MRRPRHKNHGCRGESLNRRAQCEQRAGNQHGALTAYAVREFAAHERAEECAERDPARYDLDDQWTQRERRFDARQCARDHTLVVAEEPSRKEYHDEHDGKPGCERDAWRFGGASSGGAGQSRRRAERSERARIELRRTAHDDGPWPIAASQVTTAALIAGRFRFSACRGAGRKLTVQGSSRRPAETTQPWVAGAAE